MKKIMLWVFFVSLAVFVIDWGVMGLKLLNGDYDMTAGAYVGLACIIVMALCGICKIADSKCPHCGKLLWTNGDYCSYCGKKIR